MRGKITMYNADKGYGFISSDDGSSHFFHISNIKSNDQPLKEAIVEFKSKVGEKGLIAYDIHIQSKKEKPRFINVNGTRILLNNIKNYGISYENNYFQKVYEKEPIRESFFNKLLGSYKYKYKGKTMKIDKAEANKISCGQGNQLVVADVDTIIGEIDTINGRQNIRAKKDGIHKTTWNADQDDLIIETKEFLYITTFQKDNFTFYEDEVNIQKICKELDEYLTTTC